LIDSAALCPSSQDFVVSLKFANAHKALTIDDFRLLIFDLEDIGDSKGRIVRVSGD